MIHKKNVWNFTGFQNFAINYEGFEAFLKFFELFAIILRDFMMYQIPKPVLKTYALCKFRLKISRPIFSELADFLHQTLFACI